MIEKHFMWPPKSFLSFYTGRGKLILDSRDRRLDLSDALMSSWQKPSRTVIFGLRTDSIGWRAWNEEELADIERLIRYDLNHDGFSVTIKRIGNVGLHSSKEFKWNLMIRPNGWNSNGHQMAKTPSRAQTPTRYRKARSDATIESIQRTLEDKFGLPSGSVKLVYPSGRKARADATVGSLVVHWERER